MYASLLELGLFCLSRTVCDLEWPRDLVLGELLNFCFPHCTKAGKAILDDASRR